jgi:predicted aldo/keto reductase-like oxidoreductase
MSDRDRAVPPRPAPGDLDSGLDRRSFLLRGGAGAFAVGVLGWSGCDSGGPDGGEPTERIRGVRKYVRLGRTEMEISDISFGSGGVDHPDTVRHAYDLGVNYFDTAEIYENGRSERFIGQALAGRRDKVYIATKAMTKANWSRDRIMRSLEGSLRRLGTDYVDVYFNQAVNEIERLETPEWQEFAARAKRQGKIRFTGVSGHGGRLHEVLDYAIDNDLVDVILAAHNFGTDPAFYERFTKAFDIIANQAGITRIFAKAREHDVGMICMKTLMGAKLNDLRRYEWGGATFSRAAFRWVLSNPDVNALIISMRSIGQVDEYLAASGERAVGRLDRRMLREYVRANSTNYCRNACDACASGCPAGVPIADVLRTRMYELRYEDHAKAVQSYAALAEGAEACRTCAVQSCTQACPYGLDVASLTRDADRLLRPA